ncbi:metal-dependent hydrolase [Burkholderia pseudomallei]|uniref:metal-dependent hydrolase n=1 Tax=Burkholderia pseudomallei TaxID=28450 RepID=UPI0005CAB32D|nr:metal-dependent hydrolase [Burkholderia pseudomallei]KIX51741.1 metal-dependent hydrolase family protein [Burkholderia pseudomallei]
MNAIVRRDIRFALPPDRICDWHTEGVGVTHLFNALSLLFPAGERFFMDSVRNYRNRIEEPNLKRDIAGFIGQEAMHTREHVEFNDLLQAAGLPAHKLDKRLWTVLGWFKKVLPHSMQLAITMALEHYTAMFTGLVLANRITTSEVDGYRQMWMWHSMEETEHKAVAYDVWRTVMKPSLASYLLRTGTMLFVTLVFWATLFDFNTRLLISHRRRIGGRLGIGKLVKYLWGPRNGIFAQIAREWIDYFRPGFHPWDHDNSVHLERLDDLIAEIDASNARQAAKAAPRRVPLHPVPQAV